MARDVPSIGPAPARNGHPGADFLQQLDLTEFTDRPEIEIDQAALQRYLQSRTVLITGAGGSVGTELTAQLLDLAPERLVLVDRSEHNLFQLRRHLAPAEPEVTFTLADVCDRQAMTRLLDRSLPDVVIHAAAYKHVPLIEEHPGAGFQNNTLATRRLLRWCEERPIEQFVLVSTDKAVEPRSILGATKQLAEWIVRSSEADLQTKIVRFGNVFGSRGSVIPLFAEQLAAGGPLEITHPEMERYFMSAPDACRLILQTLLLDSASVYALKMGDPIRIEWLARQILQRVRPDADPNTLITYTGRRPGEKLSEQLVGTSEATHPTAHPHIIGVTDAEAPDRSKLDELIDRFDQLTRSEPRTLHNALLSPTELLSS